MKQSRYNVWADVGNSHYVYNGVSGAVLCVPDEEYTKIESMCRPELGTLLDVVPEETIRRMAIGQMLVPDDADEMGKLYDRYHGATTSTDTFALTIVTSLGCNFDCPYCFELKDSSRLSARTQDHIVDLVRLKLRKARKLSVCWFGGEPLLAQDALFGLSDRILEAVHEQGASYNASIITNGWLLTHDVAERLVAAGVNHAQITLDGAPEHHNKLRFVGTSSPTFDRILTNIVAVHDLLPINIRVNVSRENYASLREVLVILRDAGLAQSVSLSLGQLVGVDAGVASPSASFGACLTRPEFADVELGFLAMANELGFRDPGLPGPIAAPCTAVRDNDLVVGSRGELYKCWETIGSAPEVIGHISDLDGVGTRAAKWLAYEPFDDQECRSCIALPVCMGGCAQHAMDPIQYENRCDSFRDNYRARVQGFAECAHQDGTVYIAAAALTHRLDGR